MINYIYNIISCRTVDYIKYFLGFIPKIDYLIYG